MMHEIIWRSSALRQWADASLWHEKEKIGLGEKFVEEVELLLRLVKANPHHFRVIDAPIRRALMNRFPYVILFYERGKHVVIISLHHVKRNPEAWKSRRE